MVAVGGSFFVECSCVGVVLGAWFVVCEGMVAVGNIGPVRRDVELEPVEVPGVPGPVEPAAPVAPAEPVPVEPVVEPVGEPVGVPA
jgi:hypothetical protein